ncbi:MAG: phytanoyl-CoA dioxygenase family protein [Verrucomicrobiota bacterium]
MNGGGQFEQNGFLMLPAFLASEECEALASELTELHLQQQKYSPRARGGLRNVLRVCPRAAAFATSKKTVAVMSDLLGTAAFPVRAILFDKTDGANWGVPWHQDVAIAVAEQIETPGFGPWSVKDGVVHVQPPSSVLAGMATLRLHLDDCSADNGALRVLPGSHQHGELSSEAVSSWTSSQSPVTCQMPKGGVLVMRPLLLHASSPAKNPSHRRVLHVEYAATELPNGLKWSERT